ncbi:MAG: (d)CMP kinase, partial [Thermoanaerobacteraceae bacterium]|nr:(d)CMP kinase [Thermoanaerobacteraceae bacterium]
QVAEKLGYLYIDTGAMYRALTWKALSQGLNLADEEGLSALAASTSLEFKPLASGVTAVLCDGRDVTMEIRSPEVSQKVSRVAAIPGVRRELVKHQRKMAAGGGVVMDGRDIGTYVLPEAPHKFFLTASLEERARRRWRELVNQGQGVTMEQVREEIAERDRRDSQRSVAPLRPAPDAVVIDTTNLSPEEVTTHILCIIRQTS